MMPRTTLNIEGPVLKELKRLRRRQKKPLGRLVSDILAKALAEARMTQPEPPVLSWTATDMRPKVDLSDKEAVFAAMEREVPARFGKRKPTR